MIRPVSTEAPTQLALSIQPHDLFIVNNGLPAVIEQDFRLIHSQGRFIFFGVPCQGHKVAAHALTLHFGEFLKGSHCGESKPAVDTPRYLLEQCRLHLERVLIARYSLAETNTAIVSMRAGSTAVRVMIHL